MRCAAVLAVLAVAPGHASAHNNRPPATLSIHFRQGNDRDIVAGLSFGLAFSHDGGASWQWMCDEAAGYLASSSNDPELAYSEGDAVFATTVGGVHVMRDRCTFGSTSLGNEFASSDQVGPDHAVYLTAAAP